MATKVNLLHPSSGMMKPGYYGFSWTYLFFGELGVAALHFLFSFITIGLWQLIAAFLYTKQYMTRMLEKGYQLHDDEARMDDARASLGIVKL